ncbi:MAG: ABC transporter ATP-binding protein [Paludibacteraceae bacterium]|nr:ABC transporter ATP-binding protein [Paludibacteraceae bacterium]MBP5455710.1 ABC transporter ATP-binding protein [Paludibacteraceae bacterium]MBR4840381.1 ABC transporter ATP-binding protein [Paludibacteraceae bacterium]
MKPNIIEISNLKKTYRGNTSPSVDGLTLSISEGEVFGLLGPNGAGKTTTIHILCGLVRPDSGEAKVCGYSVFREMSKIREMIGVVPQDFALYPSLTAIENLMVYGGVYGLPKRELKERIDSLLAIFDLTTNRNRRIEHYSGGMKRRVNLIAGLLHRPKVLFLDEPTVGIDVQSRHVIIENLKRFNQEGTTMVYTSHHLDEAEHFCSHIALVDEGHVICEGEPAALIAQEQTKNLEELFLKKTGKKVRD